MSKQAEVEASEEPTVEVEEETPAEEAKPAEPEEPEDTSVTYDEFLAQQAAKVVDDDVREVRSVLNDDAKFKGKELVKKDDMDDFQLEFGTGEQQLKKSRKGKKQNKKSLDEFTSTAPAGRGGKGKGGKGGKGGRGGKGYRAPALNDQHFPKLG